MSHTAFNFITNVEYSGKNALLEGNGKYNAFATFTQITSAGYSVKKGAKGVRIFSGYHERNVKDKDGKVTKQEGIPTFAVVFDICDTNAEQDPGMAEFLATESRIPSEQEFNSRVMAGVLA